VKATEKKKKRKRNATSPPAVVTLTILTPRSREVESDEVEEEDKDEAIEELLVTEDRPTRRSESPTAKRQRSWWRRHQRMPSCGVWRRSGLLPAIRPRVFRLKLRIPISAR
jgi:hypothetical protein